MTPAAFQNWVQTARKRSRTTYHVGNLQQDRQHDAATDTLGSFAYRAYEQGRVSLVQRRLNGTLHYEAERR